MLGLPTLRNHGCRPIRHQPMASGKATFTKPPSGSPCKTRRTGPSASTCRNTDRESHPRTTGSLAGNRETRYPCCFGVRRPDSGRSRTARSEILRPARPVYYVKPPKGSDPKIASTLGTRRERRTPTIRRMNAEPLTAPKRQLSTTPPRDSTAESILNDTDSGIQPETPRKPEDSL
jgi:hypothetical protein